MWALENQATGIWLPSSTIHIVTVCKMGEIIDLVLELWSLHNMIHTKYLEYGV